MTEEIVIRAYDPDRDLKGWIDVHNQPNVIHHTLQMPFTPGTSWQQRLEQPGDRARFLVAECEGRIVGSLGLHWFQGRRGHVGAIGMSVHDDFQGRGIGGKLLDAVLYLADNWLNLRRIELQVYVDNDPAVALYRKAGFRIEGTHRNFAYRNGEYVDAYAMARIRDEPSLRPHDEEHV